MLHEIGHGLGIEHHWAPYENVLGDGIEYTNIVVSKRDNGAYFSQWAKGEVNDGEAHQDDMQIISDLLGYRPDDHGDDIAGATALTITGGSVRPQTNNGVIAQDGEIDIFSFSTAGGDIDLDVRPLKTYNKLHAAADLVDGNGDLVIAGVPMFHYDYSTWPDVPDAIVDEEELNTNVRQGVKIRGSSRTGNEKSNASPRLSRWRCGMGPPAKTKRISWTKLTSSSPATRFCAVISNV